MSEGFILENVAILDGSGSEPFFGEVVVEGDRIASVRASSEKDDRSKAAHGISFDANALEADPSGGTIDGTGLTLCPGFIDIHSHADIALLSNPQHEPKLLQGVTTVVFSNCGLGFCPCMSDEALRIQREYLGGLFGDDAGAGWNWRTVGEYLERLRESPIAVNAAYLFPHGPVRVSTMGMDAREASASEIDRMVALAERSMEEGALGMSDGLWYAPMRYAAREEMVALCRVVAKRGGVWAVHLREYEDGVIEALREAIDIAAEAGVALQVSHLQTNGSGNWGRSEEMLDIIERARESGQDITADSYPYSAGSTMLQALLPEWANAGGPSALRERLRSADDCRQMSEALSAMANEDSFWESFVLSGITGAKNAIYEGATLTAGAKDLGISPPDFLLRLLVEEDLQVCYIRHSQSEGDVRRFLRAPFQMIGSDGLHVKGNRTPASGARSLASWPITLATSASFHPRRRYAR